MRRMTRESIAEDVAGFLAAGGQIKHCTFEESAEVGARRLTRAQYLRRAKLWASIRFYPAASAKAESRSLLEKTANLIPESTIPALVVTGGV